MQVINPNRNIGFRQNLTDKNTKKKPFSTPFLRQKMSYKRRINTPPKWQRNTIKKYSVRFTENTSGAYSKIMRLILMTSS